jgi:dihydroneopterin aldolase
MSSDQRWRVNIRNMQTRIPVGIHPHEIAPQRVIVNASIEGNFAPLPKVIEDCFNYDHVHKLVVKEWPSHTHTGLLETYVIELLEYIFRTDERVTFARASVCKPDIFPDTDSVGVETEWTRGDYERLILRP